MMPLQLRAFWSQIHAHFCKLRSILVGKYGFVVDFQAIVPGNDGLEVPKHVIHSGNDGLNVAKKGFVLGNDGLVVDFQAIVLGNDPYIFTKHRVYFGSDALVVDFQAIIPGVYPCFRYNFSLLLWKQAPYNSYYMMCIEQQRPVREYTSEKLESNRCHAKDIVIKMSCQHHGQIPDPGTEKATIEVSDVFHQVT